MTRARGPTRPARLALLAAIVVVVTACGTDPAPTATPEGDTAATDRGHEELPARDDDEQGAAATDPQGVPDPEQAPEPADDPEDTGVVPALLNFVAPRVGGGQVVGAEHAGEAVALWFWAPW